MVHPWLGLSLTLGKALGAGLWAAITAPFRGQGGAATAYKHVALAITRMVFDNITIEQLQHVYPPEIAQSEYESLTKKQGIPADIVDLDGTKAFWIGNKNASKLIIYFPGGGYCAPALSCHFQFLDELKRRDQDVGILLLAYGLAPENQWPGQLRQAVLALQYAIETLHKRPSNIILQGDSAGAHLALAVLSHLAHPHPDTSIPTLSLTENIQGVLCLCPWIDFDTSYESYTRNAHKDVFTARALARWAPVFLGDTSPDVYSHPSVESPPGWWGTVPVNRIFIGAGGDEILVDSIRKFAEAIKVEHKDLTFSCVPRDFHTVPINDFALGLPPGTQFNVMALWLKESFSRL